MANRSLGQSDEIERLARQATTRPWTVGEDLSPMDPGTRQVVAENRTLFVAREADAQYIAAAVDFAERSARALQSLFHYLRENGHDGTHAKGCIECRHAAYLEREFGGNPVEISPDSVRDTP